MRPNDLDARTRIGYTMGLNSCGVFIWKICI